MHELSLGDLAVGFMLSARSSKSLFRVAHERSRARYLTRQVIDRLIERGYVASRGDDTLSLTRRGSEILHALSAPGTSAVSEVKWDRLWRVVLYDIPNSHSAFRFELRTALLRAGFRCLQRSVWVHPHDHAELRKRIAEDKRLARYVLIIEVLPWDTLQTMDDWRRLSQKER